MKQLQKKIIECVIQGPVSAEPVTTTLDLIHCMRDQDEDRQAVYLLISGALFIGYPRKLCAKAGMDLKGVHSTWDQIILDQFRKTGDPLLQLHPKEDRSWTDPEIDALRSMVASWRVVQSKMSIPPFSLVLTSDYMFHHDLYGDTFAKILETGAESIVELTLDLFAAIFVPVSVQLTALRRFAIIYDPGPMSFVEFVELKEQTQKILSNAPNLQHFSCRGVELPIAIMNDVPLVSFSYPTSLSRMEIPDELVALPGLPDYPVMSQLTYLRLDIVQDYSDEANVTRLMTLLDGCKNSLEQLVLDNWIPSTVESVNIASIPTMSRLRRVSCGELVHLKNEPRLDLGVRLPALQHVCCLTAGVSMHVLNGWSFLNSRFETVRSLTWSVVDTPQIWWNGLACSYIPETFPLLSELHLTIPEERVYELKDVFHYLVTLTVLKIRVWGKDNPRFVSWRTNYLWPMSLLGTQSEIQARDVIHGILAVNQFLETANRNQERGNWEEYPAGIRNLRELRMVKFESLDRSWNLDEICFRGGFVQIGRLRRIEIGTGFTFDEQAARDWENSGRELLVVTTNELN